MISSFIAQNFAISDDYWVWNESNIIQNLKKSPKKIYSSTKMYYHRSNYRSNHDGYYDGYHDRYYDGYHDQPWLPS